MRKKQKKVICNIKPSNKICKPLVETIPEIFDDSGNIISEKSEELENKYVHEVYETMAEHFSHTRGIPWPKVKEFISSFGPGSLLLDVGCGNGRFMDCIKESEVLFLGTDRCKPLLDSALKRNENLELFVDDCMKLNLRSETFDGIICIAVLHHLSTVERRIQAISELIRCLNKNGILLIYVWAFEQQEGTVGARNFTNKDTMVPWHFQKKYVKENFDIEGIHKSENNEDKDNKDNEDDKLESNNIVRVSPDKYLIALQRYYHLFEKEEIIEICNKGIQLYQTSNQNHTQVIIKETYFDCNNWAIKIVKF